MAGLDETAVKAVYAALMSHAKKLGLFPHTSDHEPLSPPPGGSISFALIEGPIGPAPSGLAATSVSWHWLMRLYSPWLEKPASGIDPKLTAAVVKLLGSYALDLDLTAFGAPEGLIREIDVLGPASTPKWLEQDGKPFRIREIDIALIVNDAYVQGVGGG
ncbi:MAG TPA: hypothetical protein VIZ43_16845 [Trebonia sp.]